MFSIIHNTYSARDYFIFSPHVNPIAFPDLSCRFQVNGRTVATNSAARNAARRANRVIEHRTCTGASRRALRWSSSAAPHSQHPHSTLCCLPQIPRVLAVSSFMRFTGGCRMRSILMADIEQAVQRFHQQTENCTPISGTNESILLLFRDLVQSSATINCTGAAVHARRYRCRSHILRYRDGSLVFTHITRFR